MSEILKIVIPAVVSVIVGGTVYYVLSLREENRALKRAIEIANMLTAATKRIAGDIEEDRIREKEDHE